MLSANVVYNKHHLIANCNLYDVTVVGGACPPQLLAAILNSTLVCLFKFYFGRYAGTEGTLKTEVVDVNLLEVPDPHAATPQVAEQLEAAFTILCQRDTQHFVEQEFLECQSFERAKRLAANPIGLPVELTMPDRRALDLAVFELLGVPTLAAREKLCDQLYYEATAHFRYNRILDIQKQEQRAKTEGREFRTDELAADLWDALADEDKLTLPAWLDATVSEGAPVTIPEGRPNLPDATDMLDANSVFFIQASAAKGAAKKLDLPSRAHAEIVHTLASHGLQGSFRLPKQKKAAQALQAKMNERLSTLSAKALQLAHSRTTDDKKAADIANLLTHWLTHGKPGEKNAN